MDQRYVHSCLTSIDSFSSYDRRLPLASCGLPKTYPKTVGEASSNDSLKCWVPVCSGTNFSISSTYGPYHRGYVDVPVPSILWSAIWITICQSNKKGWNCVPEGDYFCSISTTCTFPTTKQRETQRLAGVTTSRTSRYSTTNFDQDLPTENTFQWIWNMWRTPKYSKSNTKAPHVNLQ